ncbi:MAG: NAD(P)/FAD-dependent oxidoreductase [Deltaproteobacteria bacterium]|nr:NAD(P)/FAD-dependent oxidoreductase [Deltaproteobacteria bacterium]
MKLELDLRLTPEEAASETCRRRHLAQALEITPERITESRIMRRTIDARRWPATINLRLQVSYDEPGSTKSTKPSVYPEVTGRPEVHIIGAGPAGLFAGLRLIELGRRPIILERGKEVKARKQDIAAIYREQRINPDSNYGFGEGGAGTYSDGKLFTRSRKRGDVRKILEVLHQHGAPAEILIDAHPHVGSNRLPAVITALRKTILAAGGEIHFETRVEDFRLHGNRITHLQTPNDLIPVAEVILATGHSAREIFRMMAAHKLRLEAKAFAMGVRIEHPQTLIDRLQYHGHERGPFLPAAAYSLATQVQGRGVYSFCMCPGGFIVPAATSDREIVVNGMSSRARDSKYANAGMVVELQLCDLPQPLHPLAGLDFQEQLERLCQKQGGGRQTAPGQRLTDFIEGRRSSSLPETSYHPGLADSRLEQWLPEMISFRLRQGLIAFNRRMPGFITDEAVLVGVESRTSSPVRIPRDPVRLQHPEIENLYPCGEGAGYAGGIISAAIDGERCAQGICPPADLFPG